MKIKKEELNRFKTNVIYEKGYRIVYFYEKHHEAPEGLYAENIEDFIKFFKSNDNNIKYTNVDDILTRFLTNNSNALGVAIYDINQNCIAKKIKNNIDKINNSTVYKEELIYDYNYVIANDGYRIVYFYPDDTYYIGVFSQTLEGFMIDFCDVYPIEDEESIPKFISTDDLLDRYLNNLKDVSAVGIYKIDGTCLQKKAKKYIIK